MPGAVEFTTTMSYMQVSLPIKARTATGTVIPDQPPYLKSPLAYRAVFSARDKCSGLLERLASEVSKGVLGFAWAQESECWIGLLEVSLGDREVLNVWTWALAMRRGAGSEEPAPIFF